MILVVGPIQDALFGFVLIANAGVGIVQELRAKRTLDRLAVLTAPKARVVRDGEVREVAGRPRSCSTTCSSCTPGDQIVVDGEVLDGRRRSRSTSRCSPARPSPWSSRPGDEVLSGSFVGGGQRSVPGDARRRATPTRLGSPRRRAGSRSTRSELRAGIDRILRIVTCAIIPTAILLFVSQLRPNDELRGALRGAVAGTVAMVPEGSCC